MIKKECKKPTRIKKLEALYRRLEDQHPKKQEIKEELSRRIAGFKGEQSLDYYFSFLQHEDHYILHNIRLPNAKNTHYFQMDILIITPSVYFIIEVKNISGTLTFDPAFDQVIWTNNITGIEKAIQDPVRQVKHQQYQFIEFLKQKKLPMLPTESFVVLTNTSTILQIISHKSEYMPNIVRSTRMLEKIEKIKNKYTTQEITTKEMNKISIQFMKHHSPECPDYLSQYEIKDSEILSGVFCEKCSTFPMSYKFGKWICPTCEYMTKEAHLEAIVDYALLFEKSITNQQFKNFLKLPTSSISYEILKSMKLQHTGGYKNRHYYLPPIELY